MSQGNFFAVGAEEFINSCKLGLNNAVAFLTLARGTGRDHATTKWSALSVHNHTGMSQRKAKLAIEQLTEAGLIEVLKAGKFPRYKLTTPSDDNNLIWLPNEIVDGINLESPLCCLREAGNVDVLEKFVLLYAEQDLDSDFGLSRNLIRGHYNREDICALGLFKLYGFNRAETYSSAIGLFADYRGKHDDHNNQGAWIVLTPLLEMSLLERELYMVESDKNHDSEIIYPLNQQVQDSLAGLIEALRDDSGRNGFAYKADSFDYLGLARNHVKSAALMAIYRLRFRPKTGKTARWYALEMERSENIVKVIEHLTREIESGQTVGGMRANAE